MFLCQNLVFMSLCLQYRKGDWERGIFNIKNHHKFILHKKSLNFQYRNSTNHYIFNQNFNNMLLIVAKV